MEKSKSTFEVTPYKPFPIEVTPIGHEGISVKGPGVDIILCVHGADFLATKLIEVANKQCCDSYVHGDECTMLLSPSVPTRPVPTCETLDELLQKIQTFVQEHSDVKVIALDDADSSLWGYSAFCIENGLETSICETLCVRDVNNMSPELRASIMPMFRTAGGRQRLAQGLMNGVRFV